MVLEVKEVDLGPGRTFDSHGLGPFGFLLIGQVIQQKNTNPASDDLLPAPTRMTNYSNQSLGFDEHGTCSFFSS